MKVILIICAACYSLLVSAQDIKRYRAEQKDARNQSDRDWSKPIAAKDLIIVQKDKLTVYTDHQKVTRFDIFDMHVLVDIDSATSYSCVDDDGDQLVILFKQYEDKRCTFVFIYERSSIRIKAREID